MAATGGGGGDDNGTGLGTPTPPDASPAMVAKGMFVLERDDFTRDEMCMVGDGGQAAAAGAVSPKAAQWA